MRRKKGIMRKLCHLTCDCPEVNRKTLRLKRSLDEVKGLICQAPAKKKR